ncbi:hypothetical protein PDL71_15225 [Lacibacter sp. MH-610]|uniref:hypothetical protein n=1 Tax=Lacibacter sp. MH-610 TaxID=3020883 RepID=UPI003891404B
MIYQFTYNVPADYTLNKRPDCFINVKVTQQIGGHFITIDKETTMDDVAAVIDWAAVKQDIQELASVYFKNRMNAVAY